MMDDRGDVSFDGRKLWELLSRVDFYRICNSANIGLNLISWLKNPEMQKLLAAALINNTHTEHALNAIRQLARSQAESAPISERQLGEILNALGVMGSQTQSTNGTLQSIADGLKSSSKPSVMGLIQGVGGILTDAASG